MNYVLFDTHRKSLLPLVYMRTVADIRTGILTIREKWEFYLGSKTSSITEDYLKLKYPLNSEDDNILINGSVLPDKQLIEAVNSLNPGESITKEGKLIAARVKKNDIPAFDNIENFKTEVVKNYEKNIKSIHYPWDIYSNNGVAIVDDFNLITKGRKSQPLSKNNFVIGDPSLVFLEEGAKVEYAFINTTDGPVYIGKNAEIMEGAKIRGPFSLGDNSVVKMDAKIYTNTTVGPWCKVGGEINNSVFFAYSNKAHDGFMGQSVIAEWCNLGADTNTSNLKNTYDTVKLWSYEKNGFVNTGQQFCGLIMGDHSKCGINTMFNTGTVVGVSCNIYGADYQKNFIPSFSWGDSSKGFRPFILRKAFAVADAMMKRRGLHLTDIEKDILTYIYDKTLNKS